MPNKTFETVYPLLDDAGVFIKFGRKKVIHSIKESVLFIQREFRLLSDQHEIVKSDHCTLISEHSVLLSDHSVLLSENSALASEHSSLQGKLKTAKDLIVKIRASHSELQKTHSEVTTKYDLVSSILSAKETENEALDSYRRIFHNDFMEFANEESSLQEEASAILSLQAIEQRLKLMVNFSDVYQKNMVAVGGGFSAGKSEFISSFFKDGNIKLPIGIKPVTAIPTYIIPGEKEQIKGYSQQGGSTPISVGLYQKLSHDFVKSFSFNLKDIMPVMAIETPLKKFTHIGFVDTPGYNPSQTGGYTEQDSATAKEFLNQSNSLIWLVGLDSNGTIPDSDIKFLESLSLKGKCLYIVANKADLKSVDDLNDIIDVFEELLDDNDIDYEGISAYSSVHQNEILYRKQSLEDFLTGVDKPVNTSVQIRTELQKVFDQYREAINGDISRADKIKDTIHSLELDLLQSSYDFDNKSINNRLEEMKQHFQTKPLNQQLKKLEKIKILMINALDNIFSDIYAFEHDELSILRSIGNLKSG